MTKKRGDDQYGYDPERSAARSLFDRLEQQAEQGFLCSKVRKATRASQSFQAEFGGCPSMVRENICSAPDLGRGRWYPSQIAPVPLNTTWAAHTVSLSPAHR